MTPEQITARLGIDTWDTTDRDHGLRAVQVASHVYDGITRDQGTPYIEHPVAVTEILRDEAGLPQPRVLVLGLLHDALEVRPSAAEGNHRPTRPRHRRGAPRADPRPSPRRPPPRTWRRRRLPPQDRRPARRAARGQARRSRPQPARPAGQYQPRPQSPLPHPTRRLLHPAGPDPSSDQPGPSPRWPPSSPARPRARERYRDRRRGDGVLAGTDRLDRRPESTSA